MDGVLAPLYRGKIMKSKIAFVLAGVLFVVALPQTLAAVPLATPEQDLNAKQAVPPSGKALVYVYRLVDASPQIAPGIWLNNRDSGRLWTNTYGLWQTDPGPLEIRGGRFTPPLTIRCEAGQTYFVLLGVNTNWSVELRQMANNTARAEMREARLVLDSAAAVPAAATVVPPASAPAPTKEVTKTEEKEASGVTLIFKVGSFLLGDSTQTIASAGRKLSNTSIAYGLEGEWRHASGYAVGLELFSHAFDYTTTTSAESGDLTVSYIFVNAKKYFREGTDIQPYIGAGIGRTVASFSAGANGGVTDDYDSNALQIMTGAVFRWQQVDRYQFNFYTELKYKHDEFTVAGGNIASASGFGLFAGLSVHF